MTQLLRLPQMMTATFMFPSPLEDVLSVQNPSWWPSAWRGSVPSPFHVTLLPPGSLLWWASRLRSAWPGGRRGWAVWHSLVRGGCQPRAWASPTHPAHLSFVFHGHSQLHPLPQAEGTSVGLHVLILKHPTGCSRSEGPCPVPADYPLLLKNETPCPQTTWPALSRSCGRSPVGGAPGRVPALALPGMPTEEPIPWGIHMPVA